jgi:septal ring factor EnvC (AmiA/AmiB activator)
MDQILKQVSRARRRLWAELFLNRLVRCWFVTLLVAAVAIAIPKLVAIENLSEAWSTWWLGGAMGVGLLVALVWTWVRGRSELEAAMEIDRRFELKERIASSLSLPPEAAESPAGRALMNDALRAINRLDIDDRFRIHVGRVAWLPLGPALLAVLLVMLVNNKQSESSASAANQTISKEVLQNSTEASRKKLEEIRKEAAKKGLKEAEDLLLQVDKKVEGLAKKEADKKQTLVKLNDLAKELNERREKLGGNDELKKQLAGLKDFSKGPADKMTDAMKNGQWDKAKQELQKLHDQLKNGKLDEKGKQELQKQLEQLKQKLQQASADRKQAIDDLKKQIDEQKKQGNLAQAGKLQQKLDQMQKQQKQSKQLEMLAKQIADAQQAMQKGDQKAAAKAMDQMAQQLAQMQKDTKEGEMLEMAMDQLESAKNAMDCPDCHGKGCEKCQGNGNMMSDRMGKMGDGDFANGYANGAFGRRAEEKNDVSFRDSQVKQNPGKGAAVIAGEAEGPNMKGNVAQAVQQEMEAKGAEPADPLVIEQLPKAQRENAEDYFNRLREGE